MRISEHAHLAVCHNGTLPNHILQAMGLIFLWGPIELNDGDCLQSIHENSDIMLEF